MENKNKKSISYMDSVHRDGDFIHRLFLSLAYRENRTAPK